MNKSVLVVAASLIVGCGYSKAPETPQAAAVLRVGAVNLGLNANQPNVRERQDLFLSTAPGSTRSNLVEAVTDFDVMCTNEMYTWSEEDSFVALVEDMNLVFPHQVKGWASSDTSGCGCDAAAWDTYVEPYRACVREDPQRDLLTCFNAPITQMGHNDPQWSPWRCTRCLTSTVLETFIDYRKPLEEQQAIIDEMDFSACRTDPEPIQCPNVNGKAGVALHSRFPITRTDTLQFPFSWSSTRGVIYAEIEHPTGPVHAFCTHIAESGTAKFSYPGYEHLTGSEDENAQHIRWSLEFIEALNIPDDESILFLGDINVGPGGGDRYTEDFPENYGLFEEAGFISTVHADGGPCTECSDNPLVVAQYAQWGNPPVDNMSTHIFLKNGPWTVKPGSSGNFLTEDVTLRSGEVTKWSDKYGMRVDLVIE